MRAAWIGCWLLAAFAWPGMACAQVAVHPVQDIRAAAIEEATEVFRTSGADMSAVEFFEVPTDRSWTRDFCPIFVKSLSEVAATNWIFNGWAKYENSKLDAAVPRQVTERLGMRHWWPHSAKD